MNDDRLDQLLDQLKNDPIPSLPRNFKSRVFQTIRASPDSHQTDEVLLPIPWTTVMRYATIMGFLAVTTGLICGSVIARSAKVPLESTVHEALSFHVFQPEGIHLLHKS